MYSDELSFLKFLNYWINYNDKQYYNEISMISAKTRGDPSTALFFSDRKMLNLEEIVLDYFGNNIHPAIVDGLYFNFNKKNELCLFFIEFKGTKLNKKAWKTYFKENIKSLPNNVCDNQHENCPIKRLNEDSLKEIYGQYADEILVQLKMKPLESLLIAIPTLFKKFYRLNFTDNFILNNYFNCYVYVVHKGGSTNPGNSHLTSKHIKNKYALFKRNGLIYDYEVYSKNGFNNNMIPKIDNFPIHFLKNMLCIIYEFKDKSKESNVKELIFNRLNEELNNESLDIPYKHKRRLVEVICKYCNYI